MRHATLVQKSVLAVVLGVSVTVSTGMRRLGPGTSMHPGARQAQPAKTQQLHYHLKLMGRDSSGAYNWAGEVDGFANGHATVTLRMTDEQLKEPEKSGALPIRTHWVVDATPQSQSLELSLSGVIFLPAGNTHLIGAIIGGNGRGQVVETRSQIQNFGTNGTVSDCDGTITIWPEGTWPKE